MGVMQPFKVEPPADLKDAEFWKLAVQRQHIYSMAGLVLGLICVVLGVVLFFHGIGGHTSWTTNILGLESKINDAAPGTILFLAGLFVVFLTRFSVKAKTK